MTNTITYNIIGIVANTREFQVIDTFTDINYALRQRDTYCNIANTSGIDYYSTFIVTANN